MTPTIHQRVHLWLWHWRTGGYDAPVLAKLYADGARVLRVQLQDDGPIPRERVDLWKSLGFKVWGAIRPSYEPLGGDIWDPTVAAVWARDEKRRLGLDGMDFNFEDEVRYADRETRGEWSETFARKLRLLCPTLPCALDTYFGSAAGGMNLGAYISRGFRMNVQTYWGPEGVYDDPVPRIVQWCRGASPTIPTAIIKPIFRVSPNNAGELIDRTLAIADCKKAGTIGLVLYPIDGADFDWLRSFIRESIAAGICR